MESGLNAGGWRLRGLALEAYWEGTWEERVADDVSQLPHRILTIANMLKSPDARIGCYHQAQIKIDLLLCLLMPASCATANHSKIFAPLVRSFGRQSMKLMRAKVDVMVFE